MSRQIISALLIGTGFLGSALSIYMTWVFLKVQKGQEVRCVDDSCPVVMKTGYAQSLGFPNSYLAIPFYIAVTVFGVLQWNGQGGALALPLAIAAFLSVVMSVYLVYALLIKLKRN